MACVKNTSIFKNVHPFLTEYNLSVHSSLEVLYFPGDLNFYIVRLEMSLPLTMFLLYIFVV